MARRKPKTQYDHAVGFSGDGRNMRSGTRGGSVGQIWWAWVGDIKMTRNQGRLEAVLCSLVDLPAGKFGSQTPPDPKYLARVCPGLA